MDLHRLILLINTVGEEILNAGILGKGNVRADVKQEVALTAERRRVPAMVRVLVVHDGRDALGVEPVRGTEPGHSASYDDDAWHRKISQRPTRSIPRPAASLPCRQRYRDRLASVVCQRIIPLDLSSSDTPKIIPCLEGTVPLHDPVDGLV